MTIPTVVSSLSDEIKLTSSPTVLRRVGWRIVPLVTLMFLSSVIDRANVSFAALSMNHDLQIDPAAFGVAAGLFFFGYFVFEVPANVIFLRRLGARIWLARILMTWGLISAGTAFVSTTAQFYILRFFLGVAEAGFVPCIIIYLAAWFPDSVRGRITGAMFIALPLANVITGPLSSYMLGLSAFGLKGWQLMFIVEGLPAVILGVAAFVWMSDDPSSAKWLNNDERAEMVRILSRNKPEPHHLALRDGFLSATVWWLAAILFCFTVGIWGFVFWGPQILKSLAGVSNERVGLLMLIPNVIAIVAVVLYSRHSDWRKERRWHIAVAGLVAALGFVLSFQSSDTAVIIFSFCLIAAGVYCSAPIYWTIPSTVLAGSAATSGIAVVNSIGNLGGYAGPYLIGKLRESTEGFSASLTAIAIFLCIGSILILAMPQLRRTPKGRA
ncbi:sugar phosphate permease [Bradyrhizobium sp. USDA 4011]